MKTFVRALEGLEYDVHQAVTGWNSIEKLFIYLDMGDEPVGESLTIEFFYLDDVMTEADASADDVDESVLSQFTLVLPLSVPEEAELEVLRFCGVANRFAPLGAFNYSDVEKAIYIRYSLMTEERDFSESLLLEVVSVFEYLCQEYMKHFTQICAGTLMAADFMNEFEEAGVFIPPMRSALN